MNTFGSFGGTPNGAEDGDEAAGDRGERFGMKIRKLATGLTVGLLFLHPHLLPAQTPIRQALALFPADTQRVACIHLAELRVVREYPQIRQHVLGRQLIEFQNFLRWAGMEPERDIDVLVLGWQGPTAGRENFFGIAEGRFDPQRVRALFAREELPVSRYRGHELFGLSSGGSRPSIYFTFLNPSLAAFAQRRDLRAMLDAEAGDRAALEANPAFADWITKLEGTAPQWGVATGRTVAYQAAPWLIAAGMPPAAAGVLSQSVVAVLHRVEWGSLVTTRLSMVCRNPEATSILSSLLNLWRDSGVESTFTSLPPPLVEVLAAVEIHADGNRVDLTASAPLEAVEQLFRPAAR